MPKKDKVLEILRKNSKRVLGCLMLISVSLMVIVESNIFVALAAVFTFPYFILWLKDNIKAFQIWLQKVKGEFSIFGEYADRFADMFTKPKKGKR